MKSKNNLKGFGLFLILFFILWALLNLLPGCYTAKKADKQISKALSHYPEKVAKIARNAFPCVETKADTIAIYKDSLIEIDCPDNYQDVIHDTIIQKSVTNKVVKVPINLPVKTIYITKIIEDSAEIFLLNERAAEINRQLNDEKIRADKYQAKSERRGKLIIWLFIILAIVAVAEYMHYKNKFYGIGK